MPLKAEIYGYQGTAYQLRGQFNEAYSFFHKSFSVYSLLKDEWGKIQTAHQCGDVLRQLERFQEAGLWYRRILRWSIQGSANEKRIKRSVYLDARCGLAMTWRGASRYAIALTAFRRCRKMYWKLNDETGRAYTLWAEGTTQRFAGRLREAEKNLRDGLTLYRRLNDVSGEAYARCALGGTLRMKGMASDSGKAYRLANRVFQRLRDNFGMAYSFCGQGNAHRMQENYRQAIFFLNKAVRIYSSLDLNGPLAYVLWSRAQAEIMTGRFKSAWEDLQRSKRLFQRVKDRRGLVYVHLGMGEYYRHQKNMKSKASYNKAIALARKLDLPFEVLHAKRHLISSQNVMRAYKKTGVRFNLFKKYRSYP